MTADRPTLIATSGGYVLTAEGLALGALVHHAVERAGVVGRSPRVVFVGTAMGDDRGMETAVDAAARAAGFEPTALRLFPMPEPARQEDTVLGADVVWVHGGSLVNLLAVWRAHGLDALFRRAWAAGVVLSGSSAGAMCWYRGGSTDSFGEPRAFADGLALLPFDGGVHLDSEPWRVPTTRRLVAEGVLRETHGVDDGVGLVYEGTSLIEAVSEVDGDAAALTFRLVDGEVEQHRMSPRRLPDPPV